MKNFFEVRNQIGLSRIGRLVWNNVAVNTPTLFFPINETFQKYYQIPQLKSTWQNTDHRQENVDHLSYAAFLGYSVSDPFKITESPPPEDSSNVENIPHFFMESKDLWGMPTDSTQIESIFKQFDFKSCPYCIILNENFPATPFSRYQEFNFSAFQERLQLYETVLFPHCPEIQFIIEFIYDDDSAKLNYLLEWIHRNRTQILGIKITDLFADLSGFQSCIPSLIRLKNELPANYVWILSGKIFPQDYALAIYLGFDIIDVRSEILFGMDGLYIGANQRRWIREILTLPCQCDACLHLRTLIPTGDLQKVQLLIVEHNLYQSLTEISQIQAQLSDSLLRTYLEESIHRNPSAAAFLRWLDYHYSDSITKRYPIINDYKVVCIGPESYTRPEIQNFMARVRKEITPARSYPIVVLLPCSAGKPYSNSKTHRKFIQIIRKVGGKLYDSIHQVIVTSPLGVVPRECEAIFPAAHYDIPVTGNWDITEVEMAGEALTDWLQKYSRPIQVIAHLAGGYRRACEYAEQKLIEKEIGSDQIRFIYTMNPTDLSASSDSALSQLRETLSEIVKTYVQQNAAEEQENNSQSVLNRITRDELIVRATFDFQFGKGVGDFVIENSVVLNQAQNMRSDEILTFDGAGKILIGNLMRDSGLVHLTQQGGAFLMKQGHNIIHIGTPTIQGTTIFRPIFGDIDESAHPNDEMIVLNTEDQFLGVGSLTQAPTEIYTSLSGRICTLRKKQKPKGSKKEIQPPSEDGNNMVKEMLGDDF